LYKRPVTISVGFSLVAGVGLGLFVGVGLSPSRLSVTRIPLLASFSASIPSFQSTSTNSLLSFYALAFELGASVDFLGGCKWHDFVGALICGSAQYTHIRSIN
jgi:hypothetical protein